MKYLKHLRLFRNVFKERRKKETDVVFLSVFLTNVCLMCYFSWCLLKKCFKNLFFESMSILSALFFFFFLKSSWLLGLGGIAFILANPMFPMLDLNPFTALAGGNQKKKKKADMKIYLYSLLMDAVNVWCRWDLKRTQSKNRHVRLWGNRENIYAEKGRDSEPSGWMCLARCCCSVRGVDLWPGATCGVPV